ncbi:MAG: 30S ribosomal protein S1 [Bdellovibrionota bacterium]|nr:30S ribosomal protein S1 [Bdellovibrionota bacterium]
MANNENLTKAQAERAKILALLDAEDSSVKPNPTAFDVSGVKDSFSELLKGEDKGADFTVGDVVKGSVISIQQDWVVVDINYKSEGVVNVNEFKTYDGSLTVKEGDEVEVYIQKLENDNGMVVLSKDKADMLRAWNDISRAAESEEIVEGLVIAKVKGGLSVDIGVKAFLPGSQIDLRPVRNLDGYIGQKLKFKVIKFNKKRGNIVLSRRVLLEEERESMRAETLDQLAEGSVVKGIVKNITDYGAFIDLGGMDGLLHITDMSWGRVKHPSELIKVAEEIEVKVLKFDNEKERVSLGLKQLTTDPWEEVKAKYPPGTKLRGEIVNMADYGAFVDLGDGIEGLIHVSEMSWTKRVKHPSQLVKVGDEVDVVVLEIDASNRRISLGMKQLETNPWDELKAAYHPGTIIEGEVKSVTDFGVFVGVEEGIDGLVHISDFSWTKRVNHPSEVYKKGDKLKVVVLGVDVENERFSLGVKQLEADPWSNVESVYPIGSQIDVTVSKIADFGVFVNLTDEIEGLIHISELSTARVDKPEDVVSVGDSIKAEVITIDQDARKIGLSAKLVKLREDNKNVDDYVQKAKATSKTTMGDLFADALKGVDVPNQD